MAEEQPQEMFREVSAALDSMPPRPPRLNVSGEYYLDRRSGGVALRIANPQGINDRILLIDLVKTEGNGGDWLAFSATFDASPGSYSSVQIVDDDGNSIGKKIVEVS